MSKIICDLCGTAFSETATQCPICGCAKLSDPQVVMESDEQVSVEAVHKPVKGGRFSKANVRKRNRSAALVKDNKTPAAVAEPNKKKDKDPDRGLVITIFVLLFAILAVIAYIVITFFGSSLFPQKDVVETKPTIPVTEAPTVADIPCQQILVENQELVFSTIGESVSLSPVAEPVDTTDSFTYFTDNDAVAIVNAQGDVTALSTGEAVITITCGEISLPIQVTVLESIDGFALNKAELQFSAAGEQWLLYDGPISMEEVVWASDDEWVATVEDGWVTAITGGFTTIYASYNGQTVSCDVFCDFESLTGETVAPTEETEPTEPVINENGPYQIKNLYGFSNSDVTIRIGESFTLSLVDKNGDKVSGVDWSVIDSSCCTVEDGVVTGTAYGQTKVVASYNGESHSFIVRVQ